MSEAIELGCLGLPLSEQVEALAALEKQQAELSAEAAELVGLPELIADMQTIIEIKRKHLAKQSPSEE